MIGAQATLVATPPRGGRRRSPSPIPRIPSTPASSTPPPTLLHLTQPLSCSPLVPLPAGCISDLDPDLAEKLDWALSSDEDGSISPDSATPRRPASTPQALASAPLRSSLEHDSIRCRSLVRSTTSSPSAPALPPPPAVPPQARSPLVSPRLTSPPSALPSCPVLQPPPPTGLPTPLVAAAAQSTVGLMSVGGVVRNRSCRLLLLRGGSWHCPKSIA
ncbi:hypothetical protein BRADI_3g15812v3 [Brachypodium distachyon]|uniref:Uncharacterized protein n=1 Tax=Brachypodium distachyon TaxID=15368 RepID=A0A2K2CXF2_BRADI|nr:hypothetical protein BRADI_3g15812v3 [Brachypodium distachyon]